MAVFLGFVGLYLLVSWLVRRRSLGPSRPVVVRSDSTFQDGAPKRTPMGRMMASAGKRPKVRHASEEQQPLEDAYAGEHMDEERELTSAEIEARDNAHAVQGQLSTLRFAPSGGGSSSATTQQQLDAQRRGDDAANASPRRPDLLGGDDDLARPSAKSQSRAGEWVDDDFGIARLPPKRAPRGLQEDEEEFLSQTTSRL